jgi:hypothetical protein
MKSEHNMRSNYVVSAIWPIPCSIQRCKSRLLDQQSFPLSCYPGFKAYAAKILGFLPSNGTDDFLVVSTPAPRVT